MALLDLLGRRMALRIIWELSRAEGPMTFRQLETAAGTNPSLLNTRLKELRAVRLVAHGDGGYALTRHGAELSEMLLPVTVWSETWAAALAEAGHNERDRDPAGGEPGAG